MSWQNRIVGEGWEDPQQLQANPANWRIHPGTQQAAMLSILEEVGWVQKVIVNQRTGFLVDGHMRVLLAIRAGELLVPVEYVDLTPREEQLVLLMLDPIGAMAVTDKQLLDESLREVNSTNTDVLQFLSDLADREKLYLPEKKPKEVPPTDEQPQKEKSSQPRCVQCPSCGHSWEQ